MILSALLTQLLPASLPEFDVQTACGADAACLEREASALSRIRDSWTDFPIAARHSCASKITTGDVTRYAGLEACLIIEQVMAPASDAEPEAVSTGIELRPAAATRSSHAD